MSNTTVPMAPKKRQEHPYTTVIRKLRNHSLSATDLDSAEIEKYRTFFGFNIDVPLEVQRYLSSLLIDHGYSFCLYDIWGHTHTLQEIIKLTFEHGQLSTITEQQAGGILVSYALGTLTSIYTLQPKRLF